MTVFRVDYKELLMKKIWLVTFMMVIAAVLTACGGGTSNSVPLVGGSLIGSSIQGKALSLTNTVSTIAGSTVTYGSTADGIIANPSGMIISGPNLYVVESVNNIILKVVISTGVVTTLAGTAGITGSADGTGAAASFNTPSNITTDGSNLFVTDRFNHTIRKIVISTGVVTTIAGTVGVSGSDDGTGTAARFNTPRGITTDDTSLFVADSANHTIRKVVISTGVVTTIAGTAGVSGSDDGTGSAARFNLPYGILRDGNNLFVADAYNSTIRKVVISTGVVTTIAGTAGVSGSDDGAGTAARFSLPFGITSDGTNLYVSDAYNCTIRKIVITTGVVSTVAGATVAGSDDGIGTAAGFYVPYGITTDGANLFVCDSGNHTIRKVTLSTGAVTTIVGTRFVSGSSDGTGTAGRFNAPAGMTTDGTNIYIAENNNNTIRKVVISTGAVTTIAGTAGVTGSTDGTGDAASFNWPDAVTTDGTNLYVADTKNNTIRKIVISTGVVTTIAGTALVQGSADGTGTDARFYRPYGITTDGTNLYVADSKNNTIRKIVISTGVVTTIAGTALVQGSADGTGTDARFYWPYGITTDGTNLYVTDSNNNTIRKIVISTGAVTTIAGAAAMPGSADGTGAEARFDRPFGITADGTNLYVADSLNATIRKIVISTGDVTTVAGKAGAFGISNGTGANARFENPDGITTDGTSLFVSDSRNNILLKIQ